MELTFWTWLPGHPDDGRQVRGSASEHHRQGRERRRRRRRVHQDPERGGRRFRRPDVAHMTYDAVPAFALTGALAGPHQDRRRVDRRHVPPRCRRASCSSATRSTASRRTSAPASCTTARTCSTAAGVEVPTTWDEYAAAAAALHTANPNAYITYLEPGLVDAPYMGLAAARREAVGDRERHRPHARPPVG